MICLAGVWLFSFYKRIDLVLLNTFYSNLETDSPLLLLSPYVIYLAGVWLFSFYSVTLTLMSNDPISFRRSCLNVFFSMLFSFYFLRASASFKISNLRITFGLNGLPVILKIFPWSTPVLSSLRAHKRGQAWIGIAQSQVKFHVSHLYWGQICICLEDKCVLSWGQMCTHIASVKSHFSSAFYRDLANGRDRWDRLSLYPSNTCSLPNKESSDISRLVVSEKYQN